MGWSVTITSNKEISIEEAKDIFSSLPVGLKGPWDELGIEPEGTDKWHAACDIYFPKGKEWLIGGYYKISGHIAEEMVEHLKNELIKNEHTISVNHRW